MKLRCLWPVAHPRLVRLFFILWQTKMLSLWGKVGVTNAVDLRMDSQNLGVIPGGIILSPANLKSLIGRQNIKPAAFNMSPNNLNNIFLGMLLPVSSRNNNYAAR